MAPKGAWSLVWPVAAVLGCADPEAELEGDSEESGGDALVAGAVNGTCAPEGMRFLDVYDCATVQGPSPKEPPVSASHVADPSATLADPDYDWVLQQLQACSCTCCHREGGFGSYRWSHDFPGAWTDSVSIEVLTTMRDSTGANTIDPADNNGFSRENSAIPTTDASRLLGFLDRDLARR